jgi:hypothetical protein
VELSRIAIPWLKEVKCSWELLLGDMMGEISSGGGKEEEP